MSRIPDKSKKEQRLEAKADALRAQIAQMQATLTAKAYENNRDDLSENRRMNVRPMRRFKRTFSYQANEPIDAADMRHLLSVPDDMARWLKATAKPGEKVTLVVNW